MIRRNYHINPTKCPVAAAFYKGEGRGGGGREGKEMTVFTASLSSNKPVTCQSAFNKQY